MTVGELKRKLQYFNDDAKVVLTSDCIFGDIISLSIQTNDGDNNSPVYIKFGRKDIVIPIRNGEMK